MRPGPMRVTYSYLVSVFETGRGPLPGRGKRVKENEYSDHATAQSEAASWRAAGFHAVCVTLTRTRF